MRLTRFTVSMLALGSLGVGFILYGCEARAHPAKSIDGYPLGWNYSPSCCNSAQNSATGDCAPISGKYVTERPDGYHLDLPVGAHPKLKTKGYKAIIPYKDAKVSPEGNFHLCITTDGTHRFCFYAGDRGV